MINKRNKMYWVNRKCKDYLLKNGYSNIYMFPHMRHQKDYSVQVSFDNNQPVFAKFDGFALKQGMVTFFQFKSNQKPSIIPYQLFFQKFRIPSVVLVYFDRKGVKEYF